MATINQLRQERLAYFREFKRVLKPVDTSVEKMQRFNARILGRTRDVPEVSDWEEMAQYLEELVQTVVALERILEAGRAIFAIIG